MQRETCDAPNRSFFSFSIRCLIFLLSIIMLLGMFGAPTPATTVLAQGGGTDDTDESDAEAAVFIRNPTFEVGTTTSWTKRPKTGNGILYAEQSQNAIPTNGSWNAALEPNGATITMQQMVLVTVKTKYRLQVWVSSNGVTTQLIWWTKEEGDHVCNTATKVFPDYGPINCDLVVPAGTTKFRVKLRALSAPSGKWVINDGWSLSSQTHFYAGARKNGAFYGVAATIGTPIPAIREPNFSYSTVNILRSCTGCPIGLAGMEAGIIRGLHTSCIPKFSFSTSDLGWSNRPIDSPRPVVGVAYRFYLFRISTNRWRWQVWQGMTKIYEHPGDISITANGGFDSGTYISANGEVDSPNRYNDMGVSDLTGLSWMTSGLLWNSWNGWNTSLNTGPPYVRYDYDGNNIQVYGNNGNPLPPGTPCGY